MYLMIVYSACASSSAIYTPFLPCRITGPLSACILPDGQQLPMLVFFYSPCCLDPPRGYSCCLLSMHRVPYQFSCWPPVKWTCYGFNLSRPLHLAVSLGLRIIMTLLLCCCCMLVVWLQCSSFLTWGPLKKMESK